MIISDKVQRAAVTDEQIVALYWARDEKAIRLTHDKYGAFLYRMAYNILHDKQDSEECQNDTYRGIWDSIPPHRPEAFQAYIAKIMRNIAGMRFRERTRKKRVPSGMTVSLEELEETLHGDDSPEAAYEAKELGRYINDYLGTLTEEQRYIFIGRYYVGDTLEVIAKELHVHASTIHREAQKIRQGLKSYLEGRGIYV